ESLSGSALADAWAAERQWRRRTAGAARQLCLISAAAMLDAIGKARIHFLAAEMKVRLARMAHGPAADTVVEIQQAGLVCDLGTRLGGNEAARWCRRNRCLLIARSLTQKTAGPD